MKLAFNPTPQPEGRGILRWFRIALLLAAGTVMFLKAMKNAWLHHQHGQPGATPLRRVTLGCRLWWALTL
jgi:hypothetical protein